MTRAASAPLEAANDGRLASNLLMRAAGSPRLGRPDDASEVIAHPLPPTLYVMLQWITTTWLAAAMVLLSVLIIYLALIVFTRLAGLRSFSKMSSFDFAMTVALGSLFATSIVSRDPPVLLALTAFAGLYLGQVAIARLRLRTPLNRWIDNRPQLLMLDGEVLQDQLRRHRVTEDDLRAKLREANVLNYSQVRAVVFETTGDVSVLHAADDTPLDPALLEGVCGQKRFNGEG